MKYSESDNEVSDEEESCSECEDYVEQAELYDSSSDSDNETTLGETMTSKNGQIKYSKDPYTNKFGRASKKNIINMMPGLTRYSCSRITDKEISSFEQFFPPPLLHTILKYTNIEGKRIFDKEWTDVDNIDMFAFFGLLLLAGVYRSNNESTESLWDCEKGRPIFGATMSLKTFKKISRVIRFDNRQTRIEILPKLYNPSENVTVNEQLVAFRGRCPFRQYMPSKPAKYGIKFWVLCDSATSYVWSIQPYTGKEIGSIPERNQGMRVVLDLIVGLKGTIRKNKPELPPEITTTKGRPIYSSSFAFTKETTLVSYIPKKNKSANLLSTFHHRPDVSSRTDKKPVIILDYNKCKGGVDTLDKSVSCYSCRRKTNRWPQVVFSNMLDISAFNAFVLFTAANHNHNWKEGCFAKRRHFLENLGMQLITPYIKKRQTLPRAPFSQEIAKKIRGFSQ
ncbi:piggyBac transposable element-derived protein 4-like [Euwallacea similis]|uniref:piggyBac transposable element-derived protein 4-like n=1 Tax=Euwallacea similis TaxID=1736056 RepID=UPI00344F4453